LYHQNDVCLLVALFYSLRDVLAPLETAFEELTKNTVQEVVNRNTALPPTEAIKITTMAGCSAVNK
jgi:hypothetical protein